MPWKCPICGTENPDDVDVCKICGSYRPTARTVNVAQQRLARVPLPYSRLVVEILDSPVEPLKGISKSVDPDAVGGVVTIGRSLENTVVVPDPSVSRRHLRVVISNNGMYVEDLGSTNGTYLLPGGERIGTANIGEEAVVKIGQTTIKLYVKK